MKLQIRLSKLSPLILVLSLLSQVDAQYPKRNKTRNPPPPLAKIRFVSGNNSLNIPFELTSDLILLQGRVNDSEPTWFILDTGATDSVIDLQLAKTLGLKAIGRTVELAVQVQLLQRSSKELL
jgi:hypothetical protein